MSGLRRIFLCADDYGMSPGVNAAIRDLIGRRRINATSVMVVAPSFNRDEADALVALNTKNPFASFGLHLTLTAPFAPLSENYAPCDDGEFLSLTTTLRAALMRRLNREKIANEIETQIAAFDAAFGRLPDFIDGHQHVQLFPQIRDALLDVVKRRAPRAWLRQCGRTASAAAFAMSWRDGKGLLLDYLSRDFRKKARAAGLTINPAFAGTYQFNPKADFAALFPGFLKDLPEGSVVMCHPGKVDSELQRLDPLTTLREAEYAYLAGDAFPRILAENHVTLDGAE
jgi:predicted glycoside hydrolase/deacetylase ChbG (UPF0249 family)